MLELKGIKKDYPAGSGTVHALKGIDLKFRKSEFVSILGQSGCGKTTMLNIIGGLDGYTDGDLVINGTSTKEYKDRDWDTYRNHSVGFVFQSYNLIPHQTVLQNVELALTLSGVKKEERRERAVKALEQVGLGDQLKKKPSEMSGGQMQRVAIARALVNNPDIILADEPTGALDTETSVQVMEVLKNISKDRLVIMVTHNPELAYQYSSRIIRMLDGEVKEDSAPLSEEEIKTEEMRCEKIKQENAGKKIKKPSMSFFTSFMLSLKNLFTKKGRTILTAFAGSIGIIGIALILAVSQGMTNYINHVQETTLTSYPITIEQQNVDISVLMESFMGVGDEANHNKDAIYKDPVVGELVDALSKLQVNKNDLSAFKKYIEEDLKKDDSTLKDILTGIQYTYSISPTIYTKNVDGNIIKSDMGELLTEMIGDFIKKLIENGGSSIMGSGMTDDSSSSMSSGMMNSMMGLNMWQELLPGLEGEKVNHILKEQYDVVYGDWPNDKNEIVLVLDENNQLNDLTLYALGLMSKDEIDQIINAAASGQPLGENTKRWEYSTITNMKFKTILPYDCYQKVGDIYVDISNNDIMFNSLYQNALELEVVGIIRPNEDTTTPMLTGSIGYTHDLTKYYIEKAYESEVVKAQIASPDVDVLTGKPFKSSTSNLTDEEKKTALFEYVENSNDSKKKEIYLAIACLEAEIAQLDTSVKAYLDSMTDKDAVIEMILSYAGNSSVDVETMKGYLESMTLEQLKEYIKPSIEEIVKTQIHNKVKESFKTYEITRTDAEKETIFREYVAGLSVSEKAQLYINISCLDAVNNSLDSMTDKDAVIEMIINNASADPSVDVNAMKAYLESKTLEELKEMVKPSLKTTINNQVKENLASYTEEEIAGMLDTSMESYTTEKCVLYYYQLTNLSQTPYTDEKFAEMLDTEILTYTTEKCALYYDNVTDFSNSTLDDNLLKFGAVDINDPATINIYVSSFENKDIVAKFIEDYNSKVDESKKISYTDFLGIMMSSITTIINAITYVLIAFVAISLVVSSIMIGVITLISVQERTKEIGILRAIGASKRDVSSMFNAETMIIGFASGLLGVVVTYLLCIPINIILHAVTGIGNLSAFLPIGAAFILIAISVLLTLISGLIPSRSAAKKDPVVALRTE